MTGAARDSKAAAPPHRHDQRLLAGRGAGVRPALRLHLRLLPEGAAAQGLAALGEARGLGRVLQSCSDRHQTSCSGGYILHCDGFLRSVHKMNLKASDTHTCLGEAAEKENLPEAERGQWNGQSPVWRCQEEMPPLPSLFQTKRVTLCSSQRLQVLCAFSKVRRCSFIFLSLYKVISKDYFMYVYRSNPLSYNIIRSA